MALTRRIGWQLKTARFGLGGRACSARFWLSVKNRDGMAPAGPARHETCAVAVEPEAIGPLFFVRGQRRLNLADVRGCDVQVHDPDVHFTRR